MSIIFMHPSASTTSGFDAEAQYQMLPSGGVRSMAIWAPGETEDLLIYPADPNKVGLFGLFALQGKAAVRGAGFSLQKEGAARFFLSGRDPGPTTLIVETERGRPRGFLLISVKPLRTVTYQLYVLNDAIRHPDLASSVTEMATNINAAAKLLFDQANIKLISATGGALAPIVSDDIGKEIIIDDPVTFAKILTAWQALKPPQADLHIFLTWDLKYVTGVDVQGSMHFSFCFVENVAPGPIATCLYAHEIGHGLGQTLHSETTNDVMFPNILANTHYSMRDIEIMNIGFKPGGA